MIKNRKPKSPHFDWKKSKVELTIVNGKRTGRYPQLPQTINFMTNKKNVKATSLGTTDSAVNGKRVINDSILGSSVNRSGRVSIQQAMKGVAALAEALKKSREGRKLPKDIIRPSGDWEPAPPFEYLEKNLKQEGGDA